MYGTGGSGAAADRARRAAWSQGMRSAHHVVDGAGLDHIDAWSDGSIAQHDVDDLASLNGRIGGWPSAAAATPAAATKSDATVSLLIRLAAQQGKMERDIELMRLELEAMLAVGETVTLLTSPLHRY